MQQLKPFAIQGVVHRAYSRDVTPWSGEAGDEPHFVRIAADRDDWYCSRRGLGRESCSVSTDCGNDGHLALDQFGSESRQSIELTLRPAKCDMGILTLDVA